MDIGVWLVIQDVLHAIVISLDRSINRAIMKQDSVIVVQVWVEHTVTIVCQDIMVSPRMVVKVINHTRKHSNAINYIKINNINNEEKK